MVDRVAITAYSDRTRLLAFHMHAGDSAATLTGTGLGEVRSVKLDETVYKPATEAAASDKERRFVASTAKDDKPRSAGATGTAEATLKDGRTVPVAYVVDAARPSVLLLTLSAHMQASSGLPLSFASRNDLPLDSRITIALRSASETRFPRGGKIEIALADGSVRTMLNVPDGSLVLQDAHTTLAFFSPAKSLGTSAFGPLQLRAIGEDGTAGDWLALGTLVRTPTITGITCPRVTLRSSAPAKPDVSKADDAGVSETAEAPCTLTGSDLFLIDSIAGDSSFSASVPVAIGFAGDGLPVPHPADKHTLYLKLRDDPDATVTVPVSMTGNAPRHSTTSPQTTAPPASR